MSEKKSWTQKIGEYLGMMVSVIIITGACYSIAIGYIENDLSKRNTLLFDEISTLKTEVKVLSTKVDNTDRNVERILQRFIR